MLNNIVLQGRLTKDPEFKKTGSDISVVLFTIACDRDFKDQQTGERETDFVDIQAWRHTAEFVSKYFQKGQQAVVEGRLQIESYTDKDGIKRKATKVVASSVHFCGGKQDAQGDTTNKAQGYQPPAPQGNYQPSQSQWHQQPQKTFTDDEELPF